MYFFVGPNRGATARSIRSALQVSGKRIPAEVASGSQEAVVLRTGLAASRRTALRRRASGRARPVRVVARIERERNPGLSHPQGKKRHNKAIAPNDVYYGVYAWAGRCARRKDRIWRTANGIRSLGSFQGNMLTSAFGASIAASMATA